MDTASRWPIYADNARPECISYVRKIAAYNMQGCDKWEGCVEDGIKHIRGFVKVHIHKDNCPNTARDFGLYSWKLDKMTGEILPVIVGKHDHCPDAVRYGLNQFIQRRGAAGIWAKLGK
jgi:phage terminase large subunit